MNERIRELALQAGYQEDMFGAGHWDMPECKKFAELIVRECVERAKSVGDLRGTNDDMIYGADVAAAQIIKHFGIEAKLKEKNMEVEE